MIKADDWFRPTTTIITTRAWPLSGGGERWRLEVADELGKQHIGEGDAEVLDLD